MMVKDGWTHPQGQSEELSGKTATEIYTVPVKQKAMRDWASRL